MSLEVSAEFKGDELEKYLRVISKNIKSLKEGKAKEMIERFSVVVAADIFKHFNEASGPSGAWASWSAIYRERQNKRGRREPSNSLRDSGHLRNSFKPANVRASSQGIMWYNNAQTKSGFPYAAHHDETASKTRPFMWLSKSALDMIGQIALEGVDAS